MRQKNDGPGGRRDGDREMNGFAKFALGLLLLALGGLLLYLLLALWPAVDAAKSSRAGSVTWFWHRMSLTADATLLLLVILVSAVGSYVQIGRASCRERV